MDARTIKTGLKPAAWGWVEKAVKLNREHHIPYRHSLLARETLLHLVPGWLDLRDGLVVDLGANAGNWTAGVTRAVPGAQVLAVEPFPPAYRRLESRFAGVQNVTLDPRAIGAQEGNAIFHVAAHDVFGSLLPSAPSLERLYGDEVAVVQEITVPVVTLDELLGRRPVSLMKVDVQGAELQVFEGGNQTLAFTQAVLVEANLVELYEGGSTFPTVYEALIKRGFVLWDMEAPHRRPNGLPVYLDVLFAKAPPE